MKNRTSDEINNCNHFEPGNIGKQNKINNEDSNGNKKPKNNKKELIFLARKTKRSNTLKNYDYPFNKESPKLYKYYTNNFCNNSVFKFSNIFQGPIIIKNYFNFMPKKTNFHRKIPITLVINDNDNSDEKNKEIEQNNESVGIPINAKLNYFESQSSSTSNTDLNKLFNQTENLI